jgi:plasmid maintenance system antidote protein VapI
MIKSFKLSVVLGRSPESWLLMQDHYDLWKAFVAAKPIRGTIAGFKTMWPIIEQARSSVPGW